MRAAIPLLLSVCAAFGATADPQALSPSVDQGKVVAYAVKSLPPGGFIAGSPVAQQVLLSQAEAPESGLCAIPLVEVQVRQDMAPMPKIRGREGFRSEMPAVQVPAPSCRQAKAR